MNNRFFSFLMAALVLVPAHTVSASSRKAIHDVSKYSLIGGLVSTLGLSGTLLYLDNAIVNAKSPEEKAELLRKKNLLKKLNLFALLLAAGGGAGFLATRGEEQKDTVEDQLGLSGAGAQSVTGASSVSTAEEDGESEVESDGEEGDDESAVGSDDEAEGDGEGDEPVAGNNAARVPMVDATQNPTNNGQRRSPSPAPAFTPNRVAASTPAPAAAPAPASSSLPYAGPPVFHGPASGGASAVGQAHTLRINNPVSAVPMPLPAPAPVPAPAAAPASVLSSVPHAHPSVHGAASGGASMVNQDPTPRINSQAPAPTPAPAQLPARTPTSAASNLAPQNSIGAPGSLPASTPPVLAPASVIAPAPAPAFAPPRVPVPAPAPVPAAAPHALTQHNSMGGAIPARATASAPAPSALPAPAAGQQKATAIAALLKHLPEPPAGVTESKNFFELIERYANLINTDGLSSEVTNQLDDAFCRDGWALLAQGADINMTDPAQKNRTVLMLVARSGYLPLVQFLTENGANVALKDREGKTAEQLARDPAVKSFFATRATAMAAAPAAAAQPAAAAPAARSIAETTFWRSIPEVVPGQKPPVPATMAGLVDLFAFVEPARKEEAIRSFVSDFAVLRAQVNGDINAKNEMGKTALMVAAECGLTTVVLCLLEAGADKEVKDASGRTALSLVEQQVANAVRRGRPVSPADREVINLLSDGQAEAIMQRMQAGLAPQPGHIPAAGGAASSAAVPARVAASEQLLGAAEGFDVRLAPSLDPSFQQIVITKFERNYRPPLSSIQDWKPVSEIRFYPGVKIDQALCVSVEAGTWYGGFLQCHYKSTRSSRVPQDAGFVCGRRAGVFDGNVTFSWDELSPYVTKEFLGFEGGVEEVNRRLGEAAQRVEEVIENLNESNKNEAISGTNFAKFFMDSACSGKSLQQTAAAAKSLQTLDGAAQAEIVQLAASGVASNDERISRLASQVSINNGATMACVVEISDDGKTYAVENAGDCGVIIITSDGCMVHGPSMHEHLEGIHPKDQCKTGVDSNCSIVNLESARSLKIPDNAEWMILGCDGIWDRFFGPVNLSRPYTGGSLAGQQAFISAGVGELYSPERVAASYDAETVRKPDQLAVADILEVLRGAEGVGQNPGQALVDHLRTVFLRETDKPGVPDVNVKDDDLTALVFKFNPRPVAAAAAAAQARADESMQGAENPTRIEGDVRAHLGGQSPSIWDDIFFVEGGNRERLSLSDADRIVLREGEEANFLTVIVGDKQYHLKSTLRDGTLQVQKMVGNPDARVLAWTTIGALHRHAVAPAIERMRAASQEAFADLLNNVPLTNDKIWRWKQGQGHWGAGDYEHLSLSSSVCSAPIHYKEQRGDDGLEFALCIVASGNSAGDKVTFGRQSCHVGNPQRVGLAGYTPAGITLRELIEGLRALRTTDAAAAPSPAPVAAPAPAVPSAPRPAAPRQPAAPRVEPLAAITTKIREMQISMPDKWKTVVSAGVAGGAGSGTQPITDFAAVTLLRSGPNVLLVLADSEGVMRPITSVSGDGVVNVGPVFTGHMTIVASMRLTAFNSPSAVPVVSAPAPAPAAQPLLAPVGAVAAISGASQSTPADAAAISAADGAAASGITADDLARDIVLKCGLPKATAFRDEDSEKPAEYLAQWNISPYSVETLSQARVFLQKDLSGKLRVYARLSSGKDLAVRNADGYFNLGFVGSEEQLQERVRSTQATAVTMADLVKAFERMDEEEATRLHNAYKVNEQERRVREEREKFANDFNRQKQAFLAYNFDVSTPNKISSIPGFVGVSEIGGRRAAWYAGQPTAMEDAIAVRKLDDRFWFFGVFDGHSDHQQVAKFCAKNMGTVLAEAVDSAQLEEAPEVLVRAVGSFDERIQTSTIPDRGNSGSTAATVLYDAAQKRLYVVNLGDSRVICVSNAGTCPLTTRDHEPKQDLEKGRIVALGGTVFRGRVNGDSAVARSLGDTARGLPRYIGVRPQVISINTASGVDGAHVEYDSFYDDKHYYQTEDGGAWKGPDNTATRGGYENSIQADFIVIACDGIWDQMNNDEVAALVTERSGAGDSCQQISEAIVARAYEKEPASGSNDNMSCVVINVADLIREARVGLPDAAPASGAGAEAPDSIAAPAGPSAADYEARQAAAIAALPQPEGSKVIAILRLLKGGLMHGDNYRDIPEHCGSVHELFDIVARIPKGNIQYKPMVEALFADLGPYVLAGGDLNLADARPGGKRRTILMRAVQDKMEDVVKWLVEHRANLSLRDGDGRSALDLAISQDWMAGIICLGFQSVPA